MQRDEFIKGTALCAASLYCTGCGLNAAEQSQPVEHYFRYAENHAPTFPTTQAGIHFSKLVAERTNGRIQISVYPAAELGDETSVIEQLQLGMIDFSRVGLSTLCEFAPFLNVLQLPFLYRDAAHMWAVLDGEIGETMRENLSDANLYGLSWFDAGARSFYSAEKPITKVEDLKGLTVRVQESSMIQDFIRALGAIPKEVIFEEVYASLQSGQVDLAENNFPSYESMEHYKVAPVFSQDEHLRVPELQLISKTTLEKLSEADRELIYQAAAESALYERELWTLREKTSRETVIDAGCTIYQLAEGEREKFMELATPIYQKYCADDLDLIEEIRTTK